MSSFSRTASPVLTIPPQPAHQVPGDGPLFSHQSSPFGHSASWSQPKVRSPFEVRRGRKRSRDEAAVNLDPTERAPPAVDAVREDEDEWEYGPGMILIKKSNGYVHDASNQSGTWLEEKAAEEEARKTEAALVAQRRQAQERPSLRSHKSSRLDTSANLPHQEVQANRSSPGRDLGDSPTSIPCVVADAIAQPVVDDFTLHLGIGWNRLSEDEHIQAAARGWARYIENHFPVTDAKIRLESKGLESYLVETNEGFFLFSENLHRGQLVSKDSHRALENLRANPPIFESTVTMVPAETPKPAEPETMAVTAPPTLPTHTDVDMDMS